MAAVRSAQRRRQLSTPRTANEIFLDALIRHQIGLLRYSAGLGRQLTELLDATENDIRLALRRRLRFAQGLERPSDVARLEGLLLDIRSTRGRAWLNIEREMMRQMRELAVGEAAHVDGLLKTSVPVSLETKLPAPARLRSIVRERPFEGRVLSDWSKHIRQGDLDRLTTQIRIGMVQGESVQQIGRRLVGTVALNGRNGVTEIARRHAMGLARTATNAISSASRAEFFQENSDIVSTELFIATLDSRTSDVCRAEDGKRYPLGEGPYPPLHWFCRSLRVGLIDEDPIGQRPFKAVTERRLLREFAQEQDIDFVPKSRSELPRGSRSLFDSFAKRRVRELTGRVPAKVSYQQWLERQPAGFQDDVLGKTRGRLFRRGGLKLDRFVDPAGNRLSLRDLARLERQAFIDAGLDPEDFLK